MKVEHARIGEILRSDRSSAEIDPASSYRQVGVRGFGRGFIDYGVQPASTLSKLRYFHLDPGRLVVSNIKGWEGAVATTDSTESGRVASNRFLQYRPIANVDVEYIHHWLLSDDGIQALGKASPGSADRNRTLSIKNFEAIVVPLPSLADQRRIAAHLDSVAAVANARAQAEREGLSRLNAVLSTGWEGEPTPVADLVRRVSRPEPVRGDERYQMAGVRWYGEGLFLRETLRGDDLGARTVYRVESGDLVYNRLFAWKESFALCRTDGWSVSNEFPTFTIDETRVDPTVLLQLLLSPGFTSQVNAASTGSTPTSRNRLKEEAFLRLSVNVPPVDRQPRLAQILTTAREAKARLEESRPLSEALLPAARNEVFSALR